MKTTFKTIIFVLLFSVTSTQAQFFKNLQKKAEEKIAREAERRAERRVNKSIDKTFDKTENSIDKTIKGKSKKDKKNNVELPTKYTFDWRMTMNIQIKEGSMDMHYLIKKDAPYFGQIVEMKEMDNSQGLNDMITIMDFNHNAIITLMKIEDNKIKSVIDIPNEIDNEENEDFNLVKIDTKTILGYFCQGYQSETKDGIITMYIAMNAPINFTKALSAGKAPKGINLNMLEKHKNGLLLEMNFISHKKKKKRNVKMVCTSLKKEKKTINIGKYKSFGF